MTMRISKTYYGSIDVTPSDTDNILFPSGTTYGLGVYIGVSGDLSVIMGDGTTSVFDNLAAGYFHDISVQRINSTNTTATGIKVLY